MLLIILGKSVTPPGIVDVDNGTDTIRLTGCPVGVIAAAATAVDDDDTGPTVTVGALLLPKDTADPGIPVAVWSFVDGNLPSADGWSIETAGTVFCGIEWFVITFDVTIGIGCNVVVSTIFCCDQN